MGRTNQISDRTCFTNTVGKHRTILSDQKSVKGKTNASYQLMLPYASIDAEAGAPRFEKSIPDAYGSRF
jgi:hypothetical protein